ncbi:unnamed protein product [Clavelina lepadiformis]|uniref:Uncharacterized protein n=1 Tax=Clavelina lepadiformis TaxID=159417 RepID=A0ABP0F8Z9_CLALP
MKSCLRYGSHSYSDDILDQLFTASQELMDAQEKNKCIKIEIDDDADSGYRSRSEDAEGNCLLSPECKTVTQSETSVTQFNIASLERNLPSVFEDIPEPVSFSNFSADHEKRVDDEFLPLMTNTSVSDDFISSIVEDDDWISSLFS